MKDIILGYMATKATKPTKIPQMGRPEKHLSEDDWKKVELFMKAGSSQDRIAQSFDLHPDTFRKKCQERFGEEYTEVSRRFNTTGIILIEATQYSRALAGNVEMLKLLGRIRCGQKEFDINPTFPARQDEIDKDHLLMVQSNQIAETAALLDAANKLLETYGHCAKKLGDTISNNNEPEAEQELRRSDPSF